MSVVARAFPLLLFGSLTASFALFATAAARADQLVVACAAALLGAWTADSFVRTVRRLRATSRTSTSATQEHRDQP